MKKFLCGILTAVTCLMLVACTPSNLDKAEDKMEAAGYKVEDYEVEKDGCVGGILATKGGSLGNVIGGLLDGDGLHAVLFETKAAAKDYLESLGEDTKAVQDGKWVYWGGEAAIEAFTK